jgi:hypothetical protein
MQIMTLEKKKKRKKIDTVKKNITLHKTISDQKKRKELVKKIPTCNRFKYCLFFYAL